MASISALIFVVFFASVSCAPVDENVVVAIVSEEPIVEPEIKVPVDEAKELLVDLDLYVKIITPQEVVDEFDKKAEVVVPVVAADSGLGPRQNQIDNSQIQSLTSIRAQVNDLQANVASVIDQYRTRGQTLHVIALTPIHTYLGRLSTDIDRLQNRISALSTFSQENVRPALVDSSAIDGIRQRLGAVGERISQVIQRAQGTFVPVSSPAPIIVTKEIGHEVPIIAPIVAPVAVIPTKYQEVADLAPPPQEAEGLSATSAPALEEKSVKAVDAGIIV